MKRLVFAIAMLFLAAATSLRITKAQTPPAPIVSPEVHADNTVTFRLRSPNAKEVLLSVEGSAKPTAMTKDDQGVWSVTTEAMVPDYYGYSFSRRRREHVRSFESRHQAELSLPRQ